MNKRFVTLTHLLAITSAMMLLSACSLLSPAQPAAKNKYLITRIPTSVPTKQTHHNVIVVSVPETQAIYNTEQMAYTNKPYQVAYFSQNEWAETPAQMLHPLLIQTLQKTHAYRSVMMPPYSGQYQYQLNTQILEFKQDFTRRIPVFVMTVNTEIFNLATNQISASKTFSEEVPIPQGTPYGGVFAANAATSSILSEIAYFCIKNTR